MISNKNKIWTNNQRYFFVTLFVTASVIMGYFDISGYGWFIFLTILSFFGPISIKF